MPTIRRAVDADAGEILTLQRAAWVVEAQLHNSAFLPALTQTLDEVRTDIASRTVLVAHDGHRMVGTARGHRTNDVWHIGRLGIVPDRQHEGLGRALLQALEEAAPDGVRTFALFTGPKSVENVAYYERHGYSRVRSEDDLIHLTKPRSG